MRPGVLRGGLIALCLAAGLPAQVTVLSSETITCCEEGFSLPGVVRRAEETIASLGLPGRRAIRFVSIIPADRVPQFSIGGSSGDYPRDRCAQVARRIRKASSHAVLALSPLGAAVSYWDSVTQQPQYRLLHGYDIFREEVDGVRVAWVDQNHDGSGRVLLVVNPSIPTSGYPESARRTVARLGIERAEVYLRQDPHYWTDRCSPASIPMQWVPPFLTDAPQIAPEMFVCKIDPARSAPDCRHLRSH